VTIISPDTPINSELRLPEGLVLKPPVRMEDLAPVDHDPAEAEALIAVIRELRQGRREPSAE